MKLLSIAVLFALLLVSCGGEKEDNTSSQQSDIDVLDLALRTELLRLYEDDTTWSQRPVFLALGSLGPAGFTNPPESLIKGLADMPMRIASVAERDTAGTHDNDVLFAVEIRKWISPTRVELNLSKNESDQTSGYSVRLVKSGGRWIFVHSFNFYSG